MKNYLNDEDILLNDEFDIDDRPYYKPSKIYSYEDFYDEDPADIFDILPKLLNNKSNFTYNHWY